MTILCTCPELPIIEVDEIEGDTFAQVEIGYDPLASETRYFMVTGLSPTDTVPELYFFIAEVAAAAPEPTNIFDSLRAAELLHRDDKKRVRKVVLRSAAAVIGAARPSRFFMETWAPHLPGRAMTKYRDLCAVFGDLSYRVSGAQDADGRWRWDMERRDRPPGRQGDVPK